MPIKSKKHIDRVRRETKQRQYLLIGTIVVVLVVLGVIVYGLMQETILPPYQPVAKVGKASISTQVFQARVRYERGQLVRRYVNNYDMMKSLAAGNPDFEKSFQASLDQIKTSLEPMTMGNKVLEEMIQEVLIRQEATRRGITVNDEDVEQAIQQEFGYFPKDTLPTATATNFPTPPPTSTLTTEQLALNPFLGLPTSTPDLTATPTMVPSPTPTFEPTAIPTITATPTVYTLEKYQTDYKTTIDSIMKDSQFSEADLREMIRDSLYAKKLIEAMTANLPIEQEQVWARHILVQDETTANQVLNELKQGGDWTTLAAKYSTDPGSKDTGGDLGWFSYGVMVKEFEDIAFKLKIGEISQPVKSQFGWHIIQVLGHETRALSSYEYQQLQQKNFQDWLDGQRQSGDVKIYDYWTERVPTQPTLPENLQ
jgi:parvulin-like peptidyl-prolyl isomerase